MSTNQCLKRQNRELRCFAITQQATNLKVNRGVSLKIKKKKKKIHKYYKLSTYYSPN